MLAIPRGGVVVGAALARELDVVLARKLRAPNQPEVAIGAISETGQVYRSQHAECLAGLFADHLAEEVRFQRRKIERRWELFRRLIVMGSHGRRGLGRLLIGSVAEQVLRRAPCPVLTAKGEPAEAALAARPASHAPSCS